MVCSISTRARCAFVARRISCVLFVALLGAAFAVLPQSRAIAGADDEESSPSRTFIGRTVDDFTLKDSRGAEHRLSSLKDSKYTVIAFLGTECPLAKLYGPRLADLSRAYKDRGVAFLAINANRQDSLTEVAAYARTHNIDFPVLKDPGNKVADSLAAERTPEVFVLDANRVIRYHGRIDDQYSVGHSRKDPTRRDLALALDQLLAGKRVQVAETQPVGCFIGRVRPVKADPNNTITYSNQIARLFQKRCVQCHRDGEIAPFPLTEYSEVVGWADTIREAVQDRHMPPWHASPEHGHFANARRLSDEEVKLVEDWVAAGAPEGDPKDLPKPIEFTAGWQLERKPDAIVTMRDTPFDVPAEGTVEYKYFTVDPEFTEDKWVRAAEVQAGNRAVVHHVLVLVRPPEDAPAGSGGGEFLAGYVPGMQVRPYPEGMAKLIPKGSRLIFQVHYTPNGSPQQDISRIGFLFADPKTINHVVVTSRAAEPRFEIPPHADDYKVEATSNSYPNELLLLALMPHMHLRGKSFQYEAVYPDGKKETLLDVPHYDFHWQTGYTLAEPKTMPAGTKIHCVAHFDNSENNLANPDPSQSVRWGDQTWNEMMIGYFDVAVPIGQAPPARRPRNSIIAATPEGRRKQAEELIQRYDADKDGKIQKKEVPDRMLPIFEAIDKNRDGVVTLEEIIAAGEAQRPR